MGTFREKVVVSNPEDLNSMELELIVDTGATYTWIPEDLLSQLKIKPRFKRKLQLADGRIIERDASLINIHIKGEELPTICIFDDTGSKPLLGAVTLEESGLGVDPVNKTLVPVPSLLVSLFKGAG
ncbi:MAG: clan AA aspartic protease [candidate division KSB1 bacterium]|nr:clan AA aspartic protease [candidate division KSB1 bacterium]